MHARFANVKGIDAVASWSEASAIFEQHTFDRLHGIGSRAVSYSVSQHLYACIAFELELATLTLQHATKEL